MTTEELLHQAIADQPEEDTPRLAFADYLDELGGEANAARAEFIRLQVMLYRLTTETPEARIARQRANELLERYRNAWGFPSGQWQSRCVIRRGFVDEWLLDPKGGQGTIKHFLRQLARFPITRLRVGDGSSRADWPSEILQLLDVPAFRKIRYLELTAASLTDLLGDLFGLEHFPSLTSLALVGIPITPSGVAGVARHPKLASLRALRISMFLAWDSRPWDSRPEMQARGVRDVGAEALATSPVLSELRELSLRASGIGTPGAIALAASTTLTKLERLILTENPDIDRSARDSLRQRFGDAVFL